MQPWEYGTRRDPDRMSPRNGTGRIQPFDVGTNRDPYQSGRQVMPYGVGPDGQKVYADVQPGVYNGIGSGGLALAGLTGQGNMYDFYDGSSDLPRVEMDVTPPPVPSNMYDFYDGSNDLPRASTPTAPKKKARAKTKAKSTKRKTKAKPTKRKTSFQEHTNKMIDKEWGKGTAARINKAQDAINGASGGATLTPEMDKVLSMF